MSEAGMRVDDTAVTTAAAALWPRLAATAPPAATSREAWLEHLASDLPPRPGLAIAEHLFGVLPLLEVGFAGVDDELLTAVRRGERHAALGCFSPNPEHSWLGAAVAGRRDGEGVVLDGAVRIATAAEAALILVRLAEETAPRLALVAADAGGEPAAAGARWLRFDAAAVPAARLSATVDLDPTAAAGRCLESYGGVYARLVAAYARSGARALRRLLRTSRHGEVAWSTAQLPTFALTELEVEVELLAAAVAIAGEDEAAHPRGLALAATATRVLALALRRTEELATGAGLVADGPFAAGETAGLETFLGGTWTSESELARTLGL